MNKYFLSKFCLQKQKEKKKQKVNKIEILNKSQQIS